MPYLDRVVDAAHVFADYIGSIGWHWVALALLCHLLKMAVRARSWRNILAASYPDLRVRWRTAFGAYAAGVGVNALIPARGGDILKLYLVKRRLPDSRYPTLASTLLVETLFDLVVASALLAWAVAAGVLPGLDLLPRLPAVDWSVFVRYPQESAIVGGVVCLLVLVLALWAHRRIRDLRRRVAQGWAVLSPPSRYLRQVVPWQSLDWLLRLVAIYFFLRAFGITATVDNALRVQVTSSISTVLPFTPGGIGTEQALLAYVLSGEASTSAILSFSVGMKIAIIAVNVTLATAVMLLMLRTIRWRGIVRRERAVRAAETPASEG